MSTGSQHQNPENEMFTELDGTQDFLIGREELDRINSEMLELRKRDARSERAPLQRADRRRSQQAPG